jgi:hypothetical protein
MRGNVYISIPAADKAKALPSAITRYDWNEYTYNEEGEVESTTKVHPTWEQYGEKYKADFGAAVSVSVKDVEFIVYELEASWKDSEISALIALGSKKAAPKYTLMSASEARKFIADNSDVQL